MKSANKSSSLFLAIVIVLSLFTTAPVPVNATDPPAAVFSLSVTPSVMFYDDFEAYTENTYPASFTLQYNGTGHANQKVITAAAHNGSSGKVFQLQGAPSWASEQYVNLPAELPEVLIVDAYIKPVSGIWPGEIALRNLSVGTWGTRVSSVWFDQSGKIYALRNGIDVLVIGEYSHGNWYRVTMENNFAAKTYNVYINETLAAENLPMHPDVVAKQLSLIAGNQGTNLIYFDEVGLYNDWSVVGYSPSATEVGITGAAVVGETLTGNYAFNAGRSGYTESGTTYRWLRDAGTTYSVFDNNNIDGVANGPSQPTVFTLATDTLISGITAYHWNDGRGATPGTISLKGDDGSFYGPWTATGLYGTLYWYVSPNIVLPAGSYTIICSDPSTWSTNYESNYRGMGWVDSKNFTGNFTPIDGATEQTYTLAAGDAGSKIKFEVTVRDTAGNAGAPAGSSAAGPVTTMPFAPANQAPVVTSDWDYTTVYFGQNYPFTVTVADWENTSGTRLYSYIDDAAPQISWIFSNEPGTRSISLSPLEGILTAGSHTLNFYAVDAAGATSAVLSLTFTLTNPPSADATLSDLSASGITLAPAFDSQTTNYTASTANSVSSTIITAVPANSLSTVAINGLMGTAREVSLSVGSNTVTVLVTAEDGTTTETYTIVIHRASSSGAASYTPPAIAVTTEVSNNSTANLTVINATITTDTAAAAITPAVVDALLNSAIFTGGTAKKDVIKVSINTPGSINELQVTIPQTSLAKVAAQTASNFAVASPFVSINFDGKALETISGAESGGSVVFSAGVVDNSALSPAARAKVQGRTVYNFTVMNDNTVISHFGGGQATVTIPYTLQAGENPHAVVVYYLADDGTLKAVRGHYESDTKSVVFKTTHFSKFVVGYNPVSFSDVAAGAWYKNAVDFIAAGGITSGTGNNRFSPEAKLTRAQFVVLLLNAYRINTQNNAHYAHAGNFTDAGDTYYTNYLLAAKGLGIVSGTGNNRFMPERTITRQEMFVMLYNALSLLDELPSTSVNNELSNFNDAGQTANWAKPALDALVKSGIVGGYNSRLYPISETTRAESAQVLYNLLLR